MFSCPQNRFSKDCQFKTFLRTFSNSELIVRLYTKQNAKMKSQKIKGKSLIQGNLKRNSKYLQSFLENFTSE